MDADLLDGLSDEALVQQIRCGNLAAFDKLYLRYWKEVHCVVLTKVSNPEDAWDITQATLWKAYQQLPTLRSACSFKSWLLAMARNASIDWLRKHVAVRTVPLEESAGVEDGTASPDGQIIGDERMKEALQQLKPRVYEVVSLYVQGYTPEEIARQLPLSVSSVRTYLSEARKILRRAFPSKRCPKKGRRLFSKKKKQD